ncbi:MAG: hypothetical protein NC203_06430 [Firmicutes bacterium]|nr:hypothetical protein [[Eubacterium] siraeum]MCM1487983.1 hypothetical protein [Bacillota bacterium]
MNVGKIAELTTPTPAATPKSTVEQAAKKDNTTSTDRPHVDKYEAENESVYTPAYTKASAKTQKQEVSDKDNGTKKNTSNVSKAKSTIAMKNEAFQSMVKDIIGKQSGAAWNAIMKDADKIQNGTLDDYWSADATAQRIFDFAQTLAGGDSSKIETLRNAVEKGFAQAGASFSKKYGQSSLPGVCQDTYKKVMDMFDNWSKESKGTSEKTEETSTTEQAD